MRNKKFVLGIAIILCVSTLAGCSKGGQEDDYASPKKVPLADSSGSYNEDTGSNSDGTDNSGKSTGNNGGNNGSNNNEIGSEADSLLSNAEITGHVVEFSDTGCIISPAEAKSVDGGSIQLEAAPGHEDPEKNVNIHYSDNCQFQFATIAISTGNVTYSDANPSDIKKQTALLIYGERSDEKNIEASKVFITTYA